MVIGLLTLMLIAWGSWSLSQLPIDAVPDVTNNQVQVITVTPSLAVQEVERLITFPVEQTMATIPSIEEVRSFSRFGLSVVTIVFTDQTDVYWARQQVFERLQQAKNQIPANIGSPELAPVTTGLGEIYQYVIRPKKGYEKKYSPMELRTIQDWIVRRQLIGTEGVAEVSSFGGFLKQYEIALDPDKLRSYHLTIDDLFTALEKNNQNTGGAYIDKKPNAYFIRSEGLIADTTDIGAIVVQRTKTGIPILIRNIGQVRYGNAVRYGAMTRNTEGEVVGAVVMMLKGENSSKVIRNVKERIERIQKTLPEGVVMEAYLDRTKLVDNAIRTVSKNLLEGALIVIFVLVILLGNLRAGLVVASVIPLAMLFAVAMMQVFGVSGNLMSLGAIDFGLIVDGAVIIVEATLHHLYHKKNTYTLTQQTMNQEVYLSAIGIRNSAAFGEIIILIVYLPILTLTGVEGKMFRPMAQVVSFAILGAFILSLTYVPMMSSLVLSKTIKAGQKTFSDKLMVFFAKLYKPAIYWVLAHRVWVVGTAVVCFVGSVGLFFTMGGEFIPTLEEGDFAVETRLVTGSSLSQTVETAQKASGILLKQFPEIKEVVGKIGSSEVPTDPMPVESCDLIIVLKDKDEWTSATSREELAEKMAKALDVLPGVSFGFQQPIQMRFNELSTGARQDVVLKIYGEDLDVLAAQARRIGKLVQPIEGVQDLYVEQMTGLPQIVIRYKRDNMAAFGLSIQDVNRVVQASFAGASAGLVYEGERRFELVVRLEAGNRQGIQDLENLYISTPSGSQVPLAQVADIEYKSGPNQIQRENAQRRIMVGFNVRGRDVESIVKEIQQKVGQKIKLPSGYYVTYGGTFQNLIEARQRLSIAVPVALLLIFALLYFTFHSVQQSLLIFTAIPLSAIGGILALWLRGMPFSISAGVGFIALFGVSVLNGIVLIGEFNRLKMQGNLSMRDIILQGTETRLRPVLMTALVASLGFLPMALSHGGGAEVQKPLATVVIGGLVSSTLLTLLVLPVLYQLFTKLIPTKPPERESPENEDSSNANTFHPSLKSIIPILLVMGGVAGSFSTFGQPTDTLTRVTQAQAVDMAVQNNLNLKAGLYEVDAQKALQKTASDLGKTSIQWMGGQYNSVLFDHNFSVSQTIPFPSVFGRRAAWLQAQVQGTERKAAVTRNELVYQVKTTYAQLVFAESRNQLLLEQDSIFSQFVEVAKLRYRTGESTVLESYTAESQVQELQVLRSQNQADISILQSQLQRLLNHATPVGVTETSQIRQVASFAVTDTTALRQNPSLAYWQQQYIVAQRQTRTEQAQLLPDLTVGYFNQSLTGTQNVDGTDRYFSSSYRFQGIQAGVAFPLWSRPQKARIRAASFQEKVAETRRQANERTLQQEWQQGMQQYRKYQQSLDYYEKTALPTAQLMLDHARKAYRAGEIGYLEYTQNLNRALSIRLQYLNTLHQYNQSLIYLEYLAGNG